jgi:hypothetical protein
MSVERKMQITGNGEQPTGSIAWLIHKETRLYDRDQIYGLTLCFFRRSGKFMAVLGTRMRAP